MTVIDELRDLSVYELARMAGCSEPDGHSTEGARMLDCVRDSVLRLITERRITLDDFNDDGQLSEVADDAPSCYTHTLWVQFVELGGYTEDCEISDAWPSDLTKAASLALYQIADRLAHAVAGAWREGWECPVCGEGVDDGPGCDDVDGCANPAGALVGLVKERMASLAAEPDDSADGDGPVKAPEVPAEPLPVRTPGASLAEARKADSDALSVFTGPVELPPFIPTPDMSSTDIPGADALRGRVSDPILSLIDQAEASDMGIRVSRAAMAHDRAVSRFRRKVWTVAGVLAVVSVPLIMWIGGVL